MQSTAAAPAIESDGQELAGGDADSEVDATAMKVAAMAVAAAVAETAAEDPTAAEMAEEVGLSAHAPAVSALDETDRFATAEETLRFHMPRAPALVSLGQLPDAYSRPCTAGSFADSLVCSSYSFGSHATGGGGGGGGALPLAGLVSPRVAAQHPAPGRQICVRRAQTTQPGSRAQLRPATTPRSTVESQDRMEAFLGGRPAPLSPRRVLGSAAPLRRAGTPQVSK